MNIKNVLDLILMHYREDDSIDHKILKEAQKMLDTKFSPFHISSTLI